MNMQLQPKKKKKKKKAGEEILHPETTETYQAVLQIAVSAWGKCNSSTRRRSLASAVGGDAGNFTL